MRRIVVVFSSSTSIWNIHNKIRKKKCGISIYLSEWLHNFSKGIKRYCCYFAYHSKAVYIHEQTNARTRQAGRQAVCLLTSKCEFVIMVITIMMIYCDEKLWWKMQWRKFIRFFPSFFYFIFNTGKGLIGLLAGDFVK